MDLRRMAAQCIVSVAGAALAGTFISGLAVAEAAPHVQRMSTAPTVGRLTKSSFLSPSAADRPWVRWILPKGVTNAQLQKELKDIEASGASGAEIGQGGWEQYPGIDQVGFILETANALGLAVSFMDGPVNSAAGFSIDDDQARKVLAFGQAFVGDGETFSGALPAPIQAPSSSQAPALGTRRSLVAVQAYRCLANCAAGATNVIDKDSRIDLTSRVAAIKKDGIQGATSEGELNWKAPSSGIWVVIALWSVGYVAQPDLLTVQGTKALTDSMDRYFAPVASALKKNHGDFFFDSHSTARGDPVDTWSNSMSADFKSLAGYSITPYLPLIARYPASGRAVPAQAFQFDPTTSKKFRSDFYQVRTDLWLKNHIKPLKRWAAQYSSHIILQPYGDNIESIDAIEASAILEKPETESLWFGDEVDNYVPEASANHMTRKTWYSIEGSAVVNGAYAQTFQDQVIHLNKAYAGGVTKLVYHVYPYDKGPTAAWPGYSNFPDSFGNSWGPRNPDWIHAKAYNDYFARVQQVLTQGDAKVDIAVYMQNYLWPQPYMVGGLQYWSDPQLARLGYTHDYLDPTLLNLPIATVDGGRLAVKGPAYQALVLDGAQMPASAASRGAMPLAIARKILAFARAGLPVIIVGKPPSAVPGMDPAGDTELRSVLAKLLAEPHIHRVETEADVPGLLSRLGIQPAAKPAAAGPVLSVHRRDADTDFYWIYNQAETVVASEPATIFEPAPGQPVATTFALTGAGEPYLLNPWDGSIKPIKSYARKGDRITIQVNLASSLSDLA